MARKSRYRWQGWDYREPPAKKKPAKGKRSAKGITNAQAKFLRDLQRQLGQPYTGAGMSKAQARAAISVAMAERDQRRKRSKTLRPATPRPSRVRQGAGASQDWLTPQQADMVREAQRRMQG